MARIIWQLLERFVVILRGRDCNETMFHFVCNGMQQTNDHIELSKMPPTYHIPLRPSSLSNSPMSLVLCANGLICVRWNAKRRASFLVLRYTRPQYQVHRGTQPSSRCHPTHARNKLARCVPFDFQVKVQLRVTGTRKSNNVLIW